MGKPAMKPWPKLSVDLPFPRTMHSCQACGAEQVALKRWLEHDDDDKPRAVVVVLCTPCSAQLIEPHPRLYRELTGNEPVPGVMGICADCIHRDGPSCTSPLAMFNGGAAPGLNIETPPPIHGHFCGRRSGGWRTIWTGAPTACSGREVANG